MPPRPRPRPKPAAASQGSNSASEASSSLPTLGKPTSTQRNAELSAEDALFTRNRSAEGWKAIEQREKESQQRVVRASSHDSDDAAEDPQRTPSKKRGRKPNANRHGSNQPGPRKLTPLALDSDSGDEVQFVDGANGAASNGKRARSRSRSITPPPMLSAAQLENARNIVRQTLNADAGPRRPPSPTYTRPVEDTSTDLNLDPELALMMAQVRSQAASRPKGNGRATSGSGQPSRAASESSGPDIVTVRVRWRPHPADPSGRAQAYGIQMRRHDNFMSLIAQVADQAGVLADDVVLTHEGRRLYASGTPQSLGIWAEVDLDASDKTTFEHLRAQRDRQRSQSVALDDDPGDARRSPSPPADTSPTREETPAPEKGEKFKLVIRAGTAKDITIAVRPTTTCGVIVRAFVKAAGLNVPAAKLAAARIIVDGDKMDNDTEIGEVDLEDGDMVEIAGL